MNTCSGSKEAKPKGAVLMNYLSIYQTGESLGPVSGDSESVLQVSRAAMFRYLHGTNFDLSFLAKSEKEVADPDTEIM